MIALLEQVSYWHWAIAAVVLLILEMMVPGVVFLWIAIAAGIMAIGSFIAPDVAWQWQLSMFAVLSVVSLVGGRMWVAKRPIQSDHPLLNERGEQAIGRVVTLTEAIVDGSGKARMGDTDWKVSGPDSAAGTKVRVVSVDGSTLIVEASQ